MTDGAASTGVSGLAPAGGEAARFAWQALGAFAAAVTLTWTAGALLQTRSLLTGLLLTALLFFLAPAAVVVLLNWRGQGDETFRRPPVRDLVWAAMLAAVSAVVVVGAGVALRRALGVPAISGSPPWALTFALGLPLPLAEELLFRPVLQRALGTLWRPRTALGITALLYALIHGSLLRFPEGLVLGLVGGIVFLKSGSYWCCALFHALANIVAIRLWPSTGMLAPLFSPVTTLFLAGVGVWLLWAWRPPDTHTRTWGAHLRWALFDHDRPPVASGWQRGPRIACLTGLTLMVVATGVGWGAQLRVMHRQEGPEMVERPVRQRDTWRFVGGDRIEGTSRLEFDRWPENPQGLSFALPYSEARLLTAGLAGQEVKVRPVGAGTFEVVWPDRLPSEPRTLTVQWALGVEALEASSTRGFEARMQALMPVSAYELRVVLAPGSGFEFESAPSREAETVFSITSTGSSPRNSFGTCGLGLRRPGAGTPPGP